jgi:replicative DNA helicase
MKQDYSEGTIPSIITNKERILENIPKEIKENGLFCLWKYSKRGENLTKPPINPNYYLKDSDSYRKKEDYYSKSNDKTRFNHLDKVLPLTSSKYGIGFGIFDTFGAIDLDHCLNEEGKIIQDDFSKIVIDIVKSLNTYTEKSPSGTGLHLYFKIKGMKLNPEEFSKKYYTNRRLNKETNQGLEIYLSGMTKKYLTITGEKLGEHNFREISFEELEPILEKYMRRYTSKTTTTSSRVTNQGDFLKIGLEKDSLLIDLYNDTTHSGNESEEDMRLLSKLAYYCNKDSQAIRQAFESSPYFMTKDEEHLQKWKREDYSENSIQRAINLVTTTAKEDNENFLKEHSKNNPTEQEEEKKDIDLDSLNAYNNIDSFFETSLKGTFKPIPTGFKKLDESLEGGLSNQSIVTIGGASSMGKTTLAINLSMNQLKNRPVIYYTLENSNEQILSKFFSHISFIKGGMTISSTNFLQAYDTNKMTEYQRGKVLEVLKDTTELNNLLVINPEGATLQEMEETINQINLKCKEQGKESPVIVLDYIQFLQSKDSRDDEMNIVKKTQRILKKYVIDNNSLAFILVANNRQGNQEKQSRIDSGRGTSDLEYSSDYNLQLNFSEWEHNPNSTTTRKDLVAMNPKQISLTIQKQRFGQSGKTIDFTFNGISNTFTENDTEKDDFYSHKRNQSRQFNEL